MAASIRLFVRPPSTCPDSEALGTKAMRQREIAGWGIQDSARCVADATLLLIAGELHVDQALLKREIPKPGCFRDKPELMSGLIDAGLIVPVDGDGLPEAILAEVGRRIEAGLEQFGPWLHAIRDVAREWAAQEELGGTVWEAVKGADPGWRQFLREVDLSNVKHDYRNQCQGINALLALLQWDMEEGLDPELIREGLVGELSHLFSTIGKAAQIGAFPHDWSDFEPLYLELAPDGQEPALSLRLPALLAEPVDRAIQMLTCEDLVAAREMVADALAGASIKADQIERQLLQCIPREARAPFAFRQVTFYPLDAAAVSGLGSPDGGCVAVSKWRATGVPTE